MDGGSPVPHGQWSTLLEGFQQEWVLSSIRRGNVETGHDWLGGQGFPDKANRSIF